MMRMLNRWLTGALFILLLNSPAWAAWELNNAESTLYYVSSKAAAISEINTFTNLSGSISNQGSASLEIDLASVDTAIEVRDQRVRDILFEVDRYPTATIRVDIDPDSLADLDTGHSLSGTYNYTLSLHGMSNDLSTTLKVTRLSEDQFEISSVQPIIINAGTFGLSAGVEALREVAGLPSINPNVVVSFSLLYEESM